MYKAMILHLFKKKNWKKTDHTIGRYNYTVPLLIYNYYP